MSNTQLTIDMVTKEAMRVAHEKLAFLSTVNREYDESFAKTGAKNGSTLRVRKPVQYTRRQNSRVMNVQDSTEESTTITLATQDGVDMRFNGAELALEIDDFSKRYIEPAMSVLVSGIESDCLATAAKGVWNLVGTAGTVVGSSSGDISAIHSARALLNRNLAPMNDRAFQLDSITMAAIANGQKSIFNPTTGVSKAFTEGFFGRGMGFDWYENERTYVHTAGSGIASLVTAADATITDGGGTGDTCTITWNGAEVVAAGDVFTLPKVFMCHPETKANTGQLMQFVVTAASTGTTATISPRVYWSGPKQNVCNSTGGACVTGDFDSETATAFGTASTAYRQNLAYHKDAFTFVAADLPMMKGGECSRLTKDGLSVRVWQDGDIRNDELLTRIDILYGFKVLRPEWAVRVSN